MTNIKQISLEIKGRNHRLNVISKEIGFVSLLVDICVDDEI